jgi:hypothetical protein
MATITLNYNAKNVRANKILDYIFVNCFSVYVLNLEKMIELSVTI